MDTKPALRLKTIVLGRAIPGGSDIVESLNRHSPFSQNTVGSNIHVLYAQRIYLSYEVPLFHVVQIRNTLLIQRS